MTKLRVEGFTISLDGFGAGPHQDSNNPLGVGGTSLHGWLFPTRTLQQKLFGNDSGETGVDDDYAARGFHNFGAYILGRNMFGPVRGPWPDESWRGWWGENPVYHAPVFVLTNHPRPPLVMDGGTTFTFVTEGAAVALERARQPPATKMFGWVAASMSSNSTFATALSTSCTLPSRQSCSALANVCSTV